MSSETNKTSNTPSATAQQMQDRQAGESPPGCRALPAAIEVCHRVFVVRGSVLWQKEAALTTHTAGNLILFHTYHLICLEQSSLSSQPCSMFFLYHSRSVLLFCLCVFAVRRAEKHTLIHTRTYTCSLLHTCDYAESLNMCMQMRQKWFAGVTAWLTGLAAGWFKEQESVTVVG